MPMLQARSILSYGSIALLFLLVVACKERNPDFDGPATTNDTGTASTSTAPTSDESTSMGPVVTGDGTSSGEPPGTSSGEPPGTSSGDPTDGSTTSCMGMNCAGECVDVMTDPDNCGMCNNNCPGQQVCVDGDCMQP
jgi:hypothetical protein